MGRPPSPSGSCSLSSNHVTSFRHASDRPAAPGRRLPQRRHRRRSAAGSACGLLSIAPPSLHGEHRPPGSRSGGTVRAPGERGRVQRHQRQFGSRAAAASSPGLWLASQPLGGVQPAAGAAAGRPGAGRRSSAARHRRPPPPARPLHAPPCRRRWQSRLLWWFAKLCGPSPAPGAGLPGALFEQL